MTGRKQRRSVAQKSSSAPVSFQEWRKKFESSLRVGTLAWKAFRELLKQEEQFSERFHLPKAEDIRGRVLKNIYKETSPRPPLDKNAPVVAKALKKLVAQLSTVIAGISEAGEKVESYSGLGLDLSADLHLFHKARNSATLRSNCWRLKVPSLCGVMRQTRVCGFSQRSMVSFQSLKLMRLLDWRWKRMDTQMLN
jgi:hypothetical protein